MFTCDLNFYVQANPFVVRAGDFLERHGLRGRAGIDHICYKCGSSQEYDHWRGVLEDREVSWWFQQEYISGRRVGYFKLIWPLVYDKHTVPFVELQDVQPETNDQAGFHHVEIYPLHGVMDYGELVDVLKAGGERLVFKNRPHHATHDVILSDSPFIIRLTKDVLVKKITQQMAGGTW